MIPERPLGSLRPGGIVVILLVCHMFITNDSVFVLHLSFLDFSFLFFFFHFRLLFIFQSLEHFIPLLNTFKPFVLLCC